MFVQKICHRRWGVGADGLAFFKTLNKSPDSHPWTQLEWEFYNSDGSLADMCANAARCAVVYNFHLHKKKYCSLQTSIGRVEGVWGPQGPQVSWSLNQTQVEEKTIHTSENRAIQGWFVHTGVPHFVVLVKELNDIQEKTCLELQKSHLFTDQGANITLLSLRTSGPHLFQTFERGVKGFTLSCGTGAIAAALVLGNQKKKSPKSHKMKENRVKDKNIKELKNNYSLKSPGGILIVELLEDSKVRLHGPAFMSFQGDYFYSPS